jgi:hypothetical protein
MAPKPEPARLAFVFGMVATILAIMAWLNRNLAAPSSSLIYHPELPLLY